jgi:hypothetical protein
LKSGCGKRSSCRCNINECIGDNALTDDPQEIAELNRLSQSRPRK